MKYFCLDCYNKKLIEKGKKPLEEKDVYLDWIFCDDCEEWLRCVIAVNSKNIFAKIKYLIKVSKWKRKVKKSNALRNSKL